MLSKEENRMEQQKVLLEWMGNKLTKAKRYFNWLFTNGEQVKTSDENDIPEHEEVNQTTVLDNEEAVENDVKNDEEEPGYYAGKESRFGTVEGTSSERDTSTESIEHEMQSGKRDTDDNKDSRKKTCELKSRLVGEGDKIAESEASGNAEASEEITHAEHSGVLSEAESDESSNDEDRISGIEDHSLDESDEETVVQRVSCEQDGEEKTELRGTRKKEDQRGESCNPIHDNESEIGTKSEEIPINEITEKRANKDRKNRKIRNTSEKTPDLPSRDAELISMGFAKLNSTSKDAHRDNWEEVDGRYVFGDKEGAFRQIPYPSRQEDRKKFHKPDLVADIAQFDNLIFMGASLRGEAHYADESVRQDSFAIEGYRSGDKQYVIASIADGVGTAKYADQLADVLVNNIYIGIKAQLDEIAGIKEIDWEEVSNYIWGVSREFCKRQSILQNSENPDNPESYRGKWASTLELFVIDASSDDDNEFVQVTISGDGGAYLVSDREWYVIKAGKRVEGKYISNDVRALPDVPLTPVMKRYGRLKHDEMLFITTDGLGDGIEESSEFREFLGDRLYEAKNLSAYLAIISMAIGQMDDDKTGILVKHHTI